MVILGIDPGNEQSALVLYDTDTRDLLAWVKCDNEGALTRIDDWREWPSKPTVLAIEMVASYGMAVGATVFETCVWIGRFIERWETHNLIDTFRVYRRDVKLHLCNSSRAKDANVRQALVDRYGGKEKAIGKKATPGPLYGLSGDGWSALAVAITHAEA